jgi:hypothetical protein
LWVAAQALHEAEHHLADVRKVIPATFGSLRILLTEPATATEPALSLMVGYHPYGLFLTIGIEFADRSGGGGGGSGIFDGPYVEQFLHEATGRMWAFGLVPKECASVSVGAVTKSTIDEANLSLNAFLIETPDDDLDEISFAFTDGTQQTRQLQRLNPD